MTSTTTTRDQLVALWNDIPETMPAVVLGYGDEVKIRLVGTPIQSCLYLSEVEAFARDAMILYLYDHSIDISIMPTFDKGVWVVTDFEQATERRGEGTDLTTALIAACRAVGEQAND